MKKLLGTGIKLTEMYIQREDEEEKKEEEGVNKTIIFLDKNTYLSVEFNILPLNILAEDHQIFGMNDSKIQNKNRKVNVTTLRYSERINSMPSVRRSRIEEEK